MLGWVGFLLLVYLDAQKKTEEGQVILSIYAFGPHVVLIFYRLYCWHVHPYMGAAGEWASGELQRYVQRQLAQRDRLLTLSPQSFEDAVAQVLRVRFGWNTHRTPYSGDGGWDVEVRTSEGRFLLVECKQFSPSKAVGRPILQKLHSAMITESASGGIMVTTSSFSGPAEDFAKKTGIQLIDGESLAKLMREAYPNEAKADVTHSMCTRCGQIIEFEASPKPSKKTCSNGHVVLDAMASVLQQMEHRARIQQYKRRLRRQSLFRV
jgi:restriction system protein